MPETAEKTTVVAAMSGGVDSSVAAALLLEQGYNVIGVTMKTYTFDEVGGNVGKETSCCGLDALNDARMVAVKLGIPHYVVDFTGAFGREVVDNFVEEYLQGRTPNPCVICNKKIKWGELLRKADALGAGFIATGHYARLRFDEASRRYSLMRPADKRKDQTYALWGLGQEALSRTLFPLGELTKPEVRSTARRLGLKTADKDESFEVCFVADDDYRRFLRERVPSLASNISEGPLVMDGQIVGRHSGYPFYTVGQRSGLGSFGERVYVTAIDARTNTVLIGRNADTLHRSLVASRVNLIAADLLQDGTRVSAQIRYKDPPSPATLFSGENGSVRVVFDEPKRAITPGQSVVFYDGEILLGGAVIERALTESRGG